MLIAYDGGDIREVPSFYAFDETFEQYPTLLAAMFYDEDNGYVDITDLEVKVGETVTGYQIFQVAKSDKAPVMETGSNRINLETGLWFKLYE